MGISPLEMPSIRTKRTSNVQTLRLKSHDERRTTDHQIWSKVCLLQEASLCMLRALYGNSQKTPVVAIGGLFHYYHCRDADMSLFISTVYSSCCCVISPSAFVGLPFSFPSELTLSPPCRPVILLGCIGLPKSWLGLGVSRPINALWGSFLAGGISVCTLIRA